MPVFAVFAAAAEIGHSVNAAHFHPNKIGDTETGGKADVKTAVAVKQGGIVAVELQPAFVSDEHRDARAVLAIVEDLLGFIVGGIEVHFRSAKDLALPINE